MKIFGHLRSAPFVELRLWVFSFKTRIGQWFSAGVVEDTGENGGSVQKLGNAQTCISAFPKRDFRQEVTDQIIEMLEKATAPANAVGAGRSETPFQ